MDYSLVLRDRVAEIRLHGAIDESTKALVEKLLPKLPARPIVVDLAGVAAVNSVGFRIFCEFLRQLRVRHELSFRSCSPATMDYFNLLPHLAFASCIHSLSVPYRCKACGGEEQPNFLAVNLSPDDDFPAKICGRCGGMSVAAVDPDQYLAFLTATSGP